MTSLHGLYGRLLSTVILFAGPVGSCLCFAGQQEQRPGPVIFPAPREISVSGGAFVLDQQAAIVVPADPSDEDLFVARTLADEVGDRFGVHMKTERRSELDPNQHSIVIGSVANPLVRAYCQGRKLKVSAADPGPEGYLLVSSDNLVLVAGSDDRGAFYGLQSLRQLIQGGANPTVPGVSIRDWPDKPFRGIKLYVPGRSNIPFFKRFVRDFMALYKYNTLIMEMNAAMRLERHPEINTGWIRFANDVNYHRRNYPVGAEHELEQNSTHQDTADGDILEKEEVADLARWVRRYHIELIPELPSFTHSYYLLSEHKDLAEVPGRKWPDTYCPSNPKSYDLLFDVYDEYLEVLKPRMIHTGHDELFTPTGLCPRCGDKDIAELYGEDIRRIHDYLTARGVGMAMWGDMLLEGVRGHGLQKKTAPDGYQYNVPGGLTPAQVERLIPKDILIFNWFWDEAKSEEHESRLDEMGFRQIYGNFYPGIRRYEIRRKRAALLGGAPSAWFATSEFGFGKDLIADFLGCSNILWNGSVPGGKELSGIVQALIPEIRVRLHGAPPPSETEASITPVDIAASLNSGPVQPGLGVDLRGMNAGPVAFGKIHFNLASARDKMAILVGTGGSGRTVPAGDGSTIRIGADATSLIFLHAAARPATNKEMFRLLWDMEDTADLLGWYEVVYEDGFVTTIPIRYGVNIQEWNWNQRDSFRDYCYGADAVAAGGLPGKAITLFAFEWKNPRLGKVIREVRLKGTKGFRGGSSDFVNDYGSVIPDNGVILAAVSVVNKRN